MDVAIVAPCPIPYQRGGAENLWRGLQDHLNEHTPHQAEVLKLPVREFSFWEILDSYRAFAELDLTGFDVVISGKYPAWMVRHPRHVLYMLHPLRGLYDAYHHFGMPEEVPDPPAVVAELLAFLDQPGDPEATLGGLWERLDALRRRADGLPTELFAFPGPLIRALVHRLDRIALDASRIVRHAAISATVRDRPGYFPPGTEVRVAICPGAPVAATGRPGRGEHLFTVSRLDAPKRIDLLVEAMSEVGGGVRLKIAGTGPEEPRLRELAGGDPRIELLGRVGDDELARLYRAARAVAFLPYDEDLGLVALEAMSAAKPVITCADSGGPRELVADGVTGLVVDPEPTALAGAIERLWAHPREARRMGRAGAEVAARITWDAVADTLLEGL